MIENERLGGEREPEEGPVDPVDEALSVREFEALFVHIRTRLVGYVTRLFEAWHVRDVSAEDVVQQTYLQLRTRARWLHRAKEDGDRKAYIVRTAYNAAVDASSRRGADQSHCGGLPEILALAQPFGSTGAVTREDERRRLRELVARLSDKYAELVSLMIEQGLDAAQAAALLGITPQVARRRYRRAAKRLAELWTELPR